MCQTVLQISGYPGIVTVHVDNNEDVADGGETVALSVVQENSSFFMDEFFKQVMFSVFVCRVC